MAIDRSTPRSQQPPRRTAAQRPHEVFISCAPADGSHLEELQKHLVIIEREGLIRIWHTGRISPGEDWQEQTFAAIERAFLVILLVSADYLASDDCHAQAMCARHRSTAMDPRTVPVIARACMWRRSWLGRLEPLPRDGKPVTHWPDRDEAWTQVAEAIATLVERIEHENEQPREAYLMAAFGASRVAPVDSEESRPPSGKASPRWQRFYEWARVVDAIDPAPRTLRAPPRYFTGRKDDVAPLRKALLFGNTKVAVITGQRGVGKTTVALFLAKELERFNLANDHIDIDIGSFGSAPLTPRQAMARVIHWLAPSADLPDSDSELASLYGSTLAGSKVLLLLRNAPGRGQVEPLIVPGCFVIVTSTSSAHEFATPDRVVCPLAPLERSDAIALVCKIAPHLTSDSAARLARACNDLPLALRVAATSLAASKGLDPDVLISDIEGRATDTTPSDAVRGAVLDCLDHRLREFWSRLGAAPESMDVPTAAAAGGVPVDVAGDLLGELVRRGLVEWEDSTDRYYIHDLLRDIARPAVAERF